MTSVLVAGKEIALKCCPFCKDGEPELDRLMRLHFVVCKNTQCNASGPTSIDRDYAVHRWNKVPRD